MNRIESIAFGWCLLPMVVASAALVSRPAFAQDIDACISASEKALALHNSQKLIDERGALATCASAHCPDAVRTSCEQRLGAVNQAIPSIVFLVKDVAGHDVAAVSLTIDGKPYADHVDGSAIALDPGEHKFRFEAAGQAPVVQRFVLHQGEQNRQEAIVIGQGTPLPPAGDTTLTKGSEVAQSEGRMQRTIGLVVGGVGLAALITGGIFGGLSIAAHNSYEQHCGSNLGSGVPSGQCDATGVSGQSDASTKGTISTVFFVAGGIAAAAGAVTYLIAPKGHHVEVGVGPGSIAVRGQF
jgi:hypothetical protein